jgi:putative ABC transport system substrate-binding protein
MWRREFIKVIVGSAAWPLAANAQLSDKPAIGFLSARSAKESAHLVDAFRKGLAEYGIIEGQNVTIDFRWAESHYERLAVQASDLLARQPTVLISVGGDMTAKVAAAATRTIPIVAIFIGDPVVGGFLKTPLLASYISKLEILRNDVSEGCHRRLGKSRFRPVRNVTRSEAG